MNIIHAVKILPRLVDDALAARLTVMPAVVLTGARQTGKSTLVEKLVPGERRYRSLDDFDVRDAARRDPEALLGGNDPLTLDEVQREPGLLTAVKRAIDRDRRPGRFLLTGSANLLLMRQVSESLAGRASYLTLWPMTRREQLGLARAGRWDELLATPDAQWRDVTLTDCRLGAVRAFGGELLRVTIAGGKIDYLNLRDAKVRELRVVGATIDDLDLAGVEAHEVVVEGSRIRRIDLTGAHLWDVTAVGVLDDVVGKLRRHGAVVEVVGLNGASAVLVDRHAPLMRDLAA